METYNSTVLSLRKIKDSLSQHRQFYMGLAILFVLLFHSLGTSESCHYMAMKFRPFKIFSYGYIGVDVFLLLSGYGLFKSYSENSLTSFYRRRFVRIVPIFLLFAGLKTALHCLLLNTQISLWDWICNLTSLSYYGLGGFFIDWYLSALLVLYLLYPILLRLSSLWIIISVIIGIYISQCIFGPLHWTWDCFISRIPIFLTGVLLYKKNEYWYVFAFFLMLFVLFCFLPFYRSRFLMVTLFTPVLFVLMFCLYNMIALFSGEKGMLNFINWLGCYSLELYVGNCIVMEIMGDVKIPIGFDFICYWGGTVIIAYCFSLISKTLVKLRR